MSHQDMIYDANKKSVGLAYVLLIFFGGFGIHRFYLGRTGSAVAMVLLMGLTLLTWWFGLGILTMLVLSIWVFVDLFLTAGMV
ncbi:MAG: TM2 domain-containing protein, partial [Bacteroidales bacterium]